MLLESALYQKLRLEGYLRETATMAPPYAEMRIEINIWTTYG